MLVLGLAACSAACSKYEVSTAQESRDAAISFTVAPLTKVGDTKTFSTGNKFQTYAWYSADKFDYTTGEEFVPASPVSYSGGSWNTATTYFWPKDGGYLSFFSWSLNSSSLAFSSANTSVTFSATQGVKVENFSSEANDDFMVADPALNMQTNLKTYDNLGVPTLFRHKTSQIAFKVKTAKNYSDKTYTLTGIKFQNVSTTGTYTQGKNSTSSESWTAKESSRTVTHYSSTGGVVFSNTPVDVPSNGTYLFIPQNFASGDSKTVTITYTIKSGSNTSTKTATLDVNTILGGNTSVATAFEKGKIYTITLIFSGNEILWNPQVQDWTDPEKNVTVG